MAKAKPKSKTNIEEDGLLDEEELIDEEVEKAPPSEVSDEEEEIEKENY